MPLELGACDVLERFTLGWRTRGPLTRPSADLSARGEVKKPSPSPLGEKVPEGRMRGIPHHHRPRPQAMREVLNSCRTPCHWRTECSAPACCENDRTISNLRHRP